MSQELWTKNQELKEKAKTFTNMEWPPHPYQIKQPSNLPEELVKLLNWLKCPSSKENDLMETQNLLRLVTSY